MQSWGERHAVDDKSVVTFCAELGPPPAALTGPDGKKFTDRWQEALQLVADVRDIWMQLESENLKEDRPNAVA